MGATLAHSTRYEPVGQIDATDEPEHMPAPARTSTSPILPRRHPACRRLRAPNPHPLSADRVAEHRPGEAQHECAVRKDCGKSNRTASKLCTDARFQYSYPGTRPPRASSSGGEASAAAPPEENPLPGGKPQRCPGRAYSEGVPAGRQKRVLQRPDPGDALASRAGSSMARSGRLSPRPYKNSHG